MVTLVEAAKLAANNGEDKRSAVIELFARESDLLRVMPFTNINGNSYAYNVEADLPNIAFRGVNQGYTPGAGVINPQSEVLKIAGGDLDVDKFLIDTNGVQVRSTHEAMKAKRLSRAVSSRLISGDSEANKLEFDGLFRRINVNGSQAVDNGGGALSLADLDAMIDSVPEATHLVMRRQERRSILNFLRSGSSAVEMTTDEFGRPLTMYGGLPILIADKVRDEAAIGGTEAANGLGLTGNTKTSIYCVSLGEGRCHGIQNGMMDVRDLGELQAEPQWRTRVEWYVSMVIEDPFSVARLFNIDATATAAVA